MNSNERHLELIDKDENENESLSQIKLLISLNALLLQLYCTVLKMNHWVVFLTATFRPPRNIGGTLTQKCVANGHPLYKLILIFTLRKFML